jgi:hypothetical protein
MGLQCAAEICEFESQIGNHGKLHPTYNLELRIHIRSGAETLHIYKPRGKSLNIYRNPFIMYLLSSIATIHLDKDTISLHHPQIPV